MNKNQETKKIKVNNFSEMFAEMRKWKNSGGEWKLLEKYSNSTFGHKRTESEDSAVGFLMSNGKKKVEIVYELYTFDPEPTTLLNPKEKQELRKIFSKDQTPFFHRNVFRGGQYLTMRVVKKGEREEEKRTNYFRFLNAWSFNDICKILIDYYQTNKTKIDQFTEKNLPQLSSNKFAFSVPWIEVGEDDKLFYIWVGERDTKKGYYRGGGELEISLKKSDLVGKYNKSGSKWSDFSEGSEELKSRLNTFWIMLVSESENKGKFGNKYTISDFENYQVGFNKGEYPVESKGYEPTQNPSSGSPNPTSSPGKTITQNSDQAKEQVRRYMEKNDIFRLTLENDKLIVEYNKTSKKEEKVVISEDLKTIQDYLKEHNNSINYEQLKNTPSATPNQGKNPDYTFLIIGGIVVITLGIFVYLVFRKRKKAK